MATAPPPPVNNTPPQIKSITASDTRVEVDTPMTITATVEDVETPIANLTYAVDGADRHVHGDWLRRSPGSPGKTR